MSSTVSAEELAGIRADIEAEILPDLATVYEVGKTSDGQGGYTDRATARTRAPVEARFDPARTDGEGEGEIGGRGSTDADYVVTFPAGTVVKLTDQIRRESDGTMLEVTRIRERDAWELSVRVEATLPAAGGPAPTS